MKTNQTNRSNSKWSRLFIALTYLFALLFAMASQHASAANTCAVVSSPSTFTLPVAVSVPRDAPVNTLIGSAVSQAYTFKCAQTSGNAYIQFRALTDGNGTPYTYSGGGIIFPTNVAGVGVLINSSPVALAYSSTSTGYGSDLLQNIPANTNTTATITAQYIKTGTITAGTVTSLQMFHTEWVILGVTNTTPFSPDTTVSLSGGTVVSVIACSVSAGSANMTVALPNVTTSAFSGLQSTAGATPFNLSLSCSSGTTVKITMATTNASSTYTGVVSPTAGTGYATGVGVQLYDVTNSAPVSFGTLTTIGASPSGTMTIPYKAQYFQTASAVTAGNVSATVTFTMTYQ